MGHWASDSRRCLGGGRELETTLPNASGLPVDADQQLIGADFQRGEQLDQGVDAGQAQPPLQLADLGAVQRGHDAQLVLGEISEPAAVGKVFPELLGDVHARSSRSKRSAARVGRTNPPWQYRRPGPTSSRTARSTASLLEKSPGSRLIASDSSGIVSWAGCSTRRKARTAPSVCASSAAGNQASTEA